MGKCTHCLDIYTGWIVCDHCENEFCPGCFAVHNMEIEEERRAIMKKIKTNETFNEWVDSMVEITSDTDIDQLDYILSEQEKEENYE